jgi:hypothetical protein
MQGDPKIIHHLQAQLRNELLAHDAPALAACIGPLSGQLLATCGEDSAAHVWRLGKPAALLTCRDFKRPVTAVALALGQPAENLVMPNGLGSGAPLIEHGRHGEAASDAGSALVAECGQHFLQATSALAIEVTLDFLAHFGLVTREPAASRPAPRRYELLETRMVRTSAFRFMRPLVGFETFEAGELIATDGEDEIRAPEHCAVLMPARVPIVGREAVYLARPIA